MDYAPGETSVFFATHKESLSSTALSTLRVLAFLNCKRIHNSLFQPLGGLFTAKNEELKFNFPTSAVDQKEACAELVNASLIQITKDKKAFTMRPEIQTTVLVDTPEKWPYLSAVQRNSEGLDRVVATDAMRSRSHGRPG